MIFFSLLLLSRAFSAVHHHIRVTSLNFCCGISYSILDLPTIFRLISLMSIQREEGLSISMIFRRGMFLREESLSERKVLSDTH